MKENSKSYNTYIFLFVAAILALFISIKVALYSKFWMDDQIANLFSYVPDSIIPFFILVTKLGDKKGIGIVALLMLAWLLLKKHNYLGAGVLSLAIALGNEVSKLLKNLFVRPRPDLEHLVDVKSYSYPSGHAMVGMVVYFLIAYLLIEGTHSKGTKIFIGVIAAVILLLIGASRIILQVHYPSDVLGGYAFGFIWVTIWISLYKYFQRRSK